MYNELLIKALRWCADESICCDDFSDEKCPYFDEKKGSCSADEILHTAADALEAAEKRIAELESNNPIVESILVDKLNQRIYELEAQIEELSLDCELFQQKCMELDAQMKTVTDSHTLEDSER